MAAKNKALSAARAQKLAANPGTRAALQDKYLTPAQRTERAKNARLNAPVTPGSALTNRDLAHQRTAATTVQYGPVQTQVGQQLAAAQQTERDTGGWYDEYLKQLATHQQNVATNATVANDAIKALVGTAGQTTQFQGTPAGATSTDAQNAAAVRQALLASFGSAAAETGRNATTYADTLAHDVGPTQKLTAQAQGRRNTDAVREKQATLGREIGAFGSKFNADTISSEQKNVLANQALTGKSAAQQATDNYRAAQIDLRRGVDPVTGKPLPKKPKAAPTGYGPGAPGMNKYGYTYGEWTKLSPADQAKARAGKPRAGSSGGGPEWLTPAQAGTGLTQVVKLKDFANRAKTGQAFMPGHKPQGRLDRAAAAKKIFAAAPSLKDPALLTAALDAVYAGHLAAETVKRLIAAGYKPSEVAKALGVPTAGQNRAGAPAYKPMSGRL